jgi:hypothetical protein
MPLSTPKPDLALASMRTHRATDRRGLSAKQDSTTLTSKWPIVTRTAYDRLVRGEVDSEMANKRLRRLCEARAALSRAMLAMDGVLHDHRPGQPGLTPEQIDQYAAIYGWMRGRRDTLQRWWLEVPLTLLDGQVASKIA